MEDLFWTTLKGSGLAVAISEDIFETPAEVKGDTREMVLGDFQFVQKKR